MKSVKPQKEKWAVWMEKSNGGHWRPYLFAWNRYSSVGLTTAFGMGWIFLWPEPPHLGHEVPIQMKIWRKTALSKIQLAGVAWRWLARAQAEEVTWMRHLCTMCATCRTTHITKKCVFCAAINQRLELCSRYTLVPWFFCTLYILLLLCGTLLWSIAARSPGRGRWEARPVWFWCPRCTVSRPDAHAAQLCMALMREPLYGWDAPSWCNAEQSSAGDERVWRWVIAWHGRSWNSRLSGRRKFSTTIRSILGTILGTGRRGRNSNSRSKGSGPICVERSYQIW